MRSLLTRYYIRQIDGIYYELLAENPFFKTGRIYYYNAEYMPKHSHQEISISWVTQGCFMENGEGDLKTGTENYIIIKPSGFIHENTFFNKCTTYTILLLDIQASRIPLFHLLQEYQWFPASNLAPFYYRLALSENSAEAYEAINLFLANLLQQKAQQPQLLPPWLSQTKANLDQHFSENISTKELAAEVGLHPVYLTRAFRKFYGVPIKSYLKQVRLHQAMNLLAEGSKSQASVAYDCGFSDQSHFIRVFREVMGTTPGKIVNASS